MAARASASGIPARTFCSVSPGEQGLEDQQVECSLQQVGLVSHAGSCRPGDDEPAAPAVLVLSHKYWRRAFGGDTSVIGRVFQMNDRPHQVIGILPPVPAYPEEVDVYMPTSACPFRSSPRAREKRDFRMMQTFGRSDLRSHVPKRPAVE